MQKTVNIVQRSMQDALILVARKISQKRDALMHITEGANFKKVWDKTCWVFWSQVGWLVCLENVEISCWQENEAFTRQMAAKSRKIVMDAEHGELLHQKIKTRLIELWHSWRLVKCKVSWWIGMDAEQLITFNIRQNRSLWAADIEALSKQFQSGARLTCNSVYKCWTQWAGEAKGAIDRCKKFLNNVETR